MFKLSESGETVLANYHARSHRRNQEVSLDELHGRLEPLFANEDAKEAKDKGEQIGLKLRLLAGETPEPGPHVLAFTGDDVEEVDGEEKPRKAAKTRFFGRNAADDE